MKITRGDGVSLTKLNFWQVRAPIGFRRSCIALFLPRPSRSKNKHRLPTENYGVVH